MSGSLTVIGGHNVDTLTGIVTVPTDQLGLQASLQAQLSAISDSVLGGTEFLANQNIIGVSSGTYGATDTVPGILVLSNTDSTGGTTSGSASFSTIVQAGYNALVVQAPGSETITGNGSQNFLAVFGGQSSVDFTSNGGTGTVVASTDNFINVSGSFANAGWSVYGAQTGADTINTNAENAYITTAGAQNIIGLGGSNATVLSGGTGDLIGSFSGKDLISVYGSGVGLVISGGADTVTAVSGSTAFNALFTGNGGSIDFINNSGAAMSISGGANGASGSVTVFGGAGGGYYQGGTSGNNSLVGGSGSVTLIGGGNNNFLSVSGGEGDALFAGDGTATLIAGVGATDAQLDGGGGTDVISSSGAGFTNIFAGTGGSETMTGSTVTGAINTYYFNNQDTNSGGGTDVITNFRFGTDKVYVNAFDNSAGVSISGIENESGGPGGAGAAIFLSDGTEIKLSGIQLTTDQQASIIGSTSFG